MVSLETARRRIEALTVEGQLAVMALLFEYLQVDSRVIVVLVARSLAKFNDKFKDPLGKEI